MKIKLCCLFLFALSIFFLPSLSSAQKRSKSKIVRANRTTSLTLEQKSYIESVIDKMDSIETNLLSKPEDAVFIAEGFFSSHLTERGFTKIIGDQIEDAISKYRSFGILFGSVYNLGAFNAQNRYTIATGGKSSNLASSIIRSYGLQFQSPGQAVYNLHAQAFAARNRLQFTLLNSPTLVSKEETNSIKPQQTTELKQTVINSPNLPYKVPNKPLVLLDSENKIVEQESKSTLRSWEISVADKRIAPFSNFNFLIEQNDRNLVLKIQEYQGSVWHLPILEQDNKYFIEFLLPENGISQTYKFVFDKFLSVPNRAVPNLGIVFLKTDSSYKYLNSFMINLSK